MADDLLQTRKPMAIPKEKLHYNWPRNSYMEAHKAYIADRLAQNHPLFREKQEHVKSVSFMPDASIDDKMIPQGMVLEVDPDTPVFLLMGHIPDLYGAVSSCRLTCPSRESGGDIQAYEENMERVVNTYFRSYAKKVGDREDLPGPERLDDEHKLWVLDYSVFSSRAAAGASYANIPSYATLGSVGTQVLLVKQTTSTGHPAYMLVVKNYSQKRSDFLHRQMSERHSGEARMVPYTVGTFVGDTTIDRKIAALVHEQQAFISWMVLHVFDIEQYAQAYKIPSNDRENMPGLDKVVKLASCNLYNALIRRENRYFFYDRCQYRSIAYRPPNEILAQSQIDLVFLGYGYGVMVFRDAGSSLTMNVWGQVTSSTRAAPSVAEGIFQGLPLFTTERKTRTYREDFGALRKDKDAWSFMYNNIREPLTGEIFYGGDYVNIDPADLHFHRTHFNPRMDESYPAFIDAMKPFFTTRPDYTVFKLVSNYIASSPKAIITPYSLAHDVAEVVNATIELERKRGVEPTTLFVEGVLKEWAKKYGLTMVVTYLGETGRLLREHAEAVFEKHGDIFGRDRASQIADRIMTESGDKRVFVTAIPLLTLYTMTQDYHGDIHKYYAGEHLEDETYGAIKRFLLGVVGRTDD